MLALRVILNTCELDLEDQRLAMPGIKRSEACMDSAGILRIVSNQHFRCVHLRFMKLLGVVKSFDASPEDFQKHLDFGQDDGQTAENGDNVANYPGSSSAVGKAGKGTILREILGALFFAKGLSKRNLDGMIVVCKLPHMRW